MHTLKLEGTTPRGHRYNVRTKICPCTFGFYFIAKIYVNGHYEAVEVTSYKTQEQYKAAAIEALTILGDRYGLKLIKLKQLKTA